jgi:hypothetical protein
VFPFNVARQVFTFQFIPMTKFSYI